MDACTHETHAPQSRPSVTVFGLDGKATASTKLPAVLTAPIRPDVVRLVHTGLAKNKRQPYAVSAKAGHQTSAVSWGTGRAVARIPRVGGGGTARAGQAAFGNMCRGGRMFAPTKTFRKWHVAVARSQRRFAVASALAASALPSLVMARGHRIDAIPEVPLVVSSIASSLNKTKLAVALLKALKAYSDVEKVISSKKLRAGIGKIRNRRYTQRRGPLVIYDNDDGIVRAFRNIPGVETCSVERLNLLQLAPGGHVGRFVLWTQDAFEQLDALFGTRSKPSTLKRGFSLPQPLVANPDLGRLINSSEVQSVLRKANPSRTKRPFTQRKNPLRNMGVLVRLNPYAQTLRRRDIMAQMARKQGKVSKKHQQQKSKILKNKKKVKNTEFVKSMLSLE